MLRESISIRLLLPWRREALGAAEVVEVPMTSADRRRVRRLLEALDGTMFALELPTGTVLKPGQVLHVEDGRAYVVEAAPEDVLLVYPRTLGEAARAGHLIGNLHRDIDLDGPFLTVLCEGTIEDRLRRAGFVVERGRRPFLGDPPRGASETVTVWENSASGNGIVSPA